MRPVLFVSSDISRGLVLFARRLAALGHQITIAAPKSDNEKYLLDLPSIRIWKFRIFGREFLMGTKSLRNFIIKNNPIIHALDENSFKIVKKYNAFLKPLDFGIDLKIWNTNAVSIPRQTRLLSEYNIAPHQKLITVISPLGENLSNLLAAMSEIDRDDVVIALCGTAHGRLAKHIVKSVLMSGQSGRVIYIGASEDLPTVMRASFATISVSGGNHRTKKFATAIGRPTIWESNNTEIKPNIAMRDNSASAIKESIICALDINGKDRAAAERQNCAAATCFDIGHTVSDCLRLYNS